MLYIFLWAGGKDDVKMKENTRQFEESIRVQGSSIGL
jgi:hypothetical protein